MDKVVTNATLVVPTSWSLIPSGISAGGSFRLLFVSSTKRDATSTDIADYNAHVQNAAAMGHADIQAHSGLFRALASTSSVSAVVNTETNHSSTVKAYPSIG